MKSLLKYWVIMIVVITGTLITWNLQVEFLILKGIQVIYAEIMSLLVMLFIVFIMNRINPKDIFAGNPIILLVNVAYFMFVGYMARTLYEVTLPNQVFVEVILPIIAALCMHFGILATKYCNE